MGSNNDLQERVDFIAKQCECLTENGAWYEDYTDEERAVYDKACEKCEGEIGVGAYLQDTYDIMYYIHSNFKEKGIDGAKVCVALGGPNIYINTYTGEVQGAWGSSTATASISDSACEVIDNWLNEMLMCTI